MSFFSSFSLSSPSSSSSSSSTSKEEKEIPLNSNPLLRLHYTNPLLVASLSSILLFSTNKIWNRFGKRIKNSDYLRSDAFNLKGKGKGKRIRGVCTSVGDADNFRLFHTPPLRKFMKIPTTKLELKNNTIHIRLAGVDAPECAHFGNEAQPFSKEALEWLTAKVLNRKVIVDLFSKDRYGRVVGMAYTRPFPWIRRHNISAEMLKAGLATVYTLGGAQHAGLKDHFDQLEAKAKSQKKGMWSLDNKKYESPGDYKKRTTGSNGL